MNAEHARTPRAIVIDLDCMTGLQTARILAGHNVPVVGIARDAKHPCSRTNVCEQVHIADTAGEEFIELLEKMGPHWKQKPVLFPCADLSVLMLSRNRESLQAWYEILLPEPHVIEMMMDKFSFLDFAQKEGLPIPKTYFLKRRSEAEQAAQELSYPCLLKPPVRTQQWKDSTPAKAIKIVSPEHLLETYDQCAPWAQMLLVQEWIEGTDADLYSCNCYFNANSEPVVTFVSRKLRQWPPEVGTSCLAEEVRDDFVLEETVKLFRKVNFRGLGYVEMKKDPTSGKHYIVEPNIGRPTGRSAIAEAGGVELVYSAYCDAVGLPLPENRKQKYQGAKWIYLRRDCQSALHYWRRGELTLGEWWKSLQGQKTDALFSWRDPAPFLLDLYKGLGKFTLNGSTNGHKPATAAAVAPAVSSNGHKRAEKQEVEAPVAKEPSPQTFDYDIHGIVGVRLVNAWESDAAAVARQLGPLQQTLTREPEIVVRFVEKLPTPNLQYVELEKSGFAGDDFYLLESGKRKAKARIAFEQIGGQCEIVCESGLSAVPLLMAIVNVTALKKRWVALHASAFEYEGTGVLLTGWSKGGKTEALLAFAAQGAKFIGDEWILLDESGERMYGIPENIRLCDWHLESLSEARKHVKGTKLFVFRAVRWLDRMQSAMANTWMGRLLPFRLLREALPAVKRQLNVQLEPEKIFGAGIGPFEGKLEKVFFLMSHEGEEISVEATDPRQVAMRMAASVQYEQQQLFGNYLAYKFAFPARRNELLERAAILQCNLLGHALAGKEAYVVRHPYRVSLDKLYEAMKPYCAVRGERA